MANIYDAGDYEINLLQKELAKSGIAQDQLDLSNYAGLTYPELRSIVDAAITNKKMKEALSNGRPSSDTSGGSKGTADKAE